MQYCVYDSGKYFCDVNQKFYKTYSDCFSNCGYEVNDTLIHISNVDITFLFALAGIVVGSLIVYAFIISTD